MFNKVCAFLCATVLTLSTGVSAFAAENSIEITDSGIDWSTLPASLMGTLMTPLIVGIGIGLSLWVVMIGVRLLRRNAKS